MRNVKEKILKNHRKLDKKLKEARQKRTKPIKNYDKMWKNKRKSCKHMKKSLKIIEI